MAGCQETCTVEVLSLAPIQELLEAPVSMAAGDIGSTEMQLLSMEEALPGHVLSGIINKVKDARDLANCMATSKTMSDAVQQVPNLTLTCRKRYYELARERYPIRRPCSFSDDDDDDDDNVNDDNVDQENDDDDDDDDDDSNEDDDDETCEWSSAPVAPAPDDGGAGVGAGALDSSSSPRSSSTYQPGVPGHVSFKTACLNMLRKVSHVQQLRIEVDQDMQANLFQKEEIHMVDFWFSEPMFVRKWVSLCKLSLRHLTVVDYGQQAIMRQSNIVRVLSQNCKDLRHLELRNMYLDTNDLEVLPKVESLTLRCIKMTDKALTDINNCMPALLTLALVSVFGVQEAQFSSPQLQVLCLGLSTPARTVDLNLPLCTKLQLKMTCPDSLRVRAPSLAYVAVCMEKRDGSVVEFDDVINLRELLFGASHFATLSKLMRSNLHLEKIFLDVPCMALGEDGKWEGVLEQIPRNLPDIEALKMSCPALHTLSVGPGLWHSMEESFVVNQELATFRGWPALSRLIVHMVVQSLETCVGILQWLISELPSLKGLEIYVHDDSPIHPELFRSVCKERLMLANLQWGTWKRSLNFACFSF